MERSYLSKATPLRVLTVQCLTWALTPTSCGTWGESSLSPSFLTYKMEIITVPTLWGCGEMHVRGRVPVHPWHIAGVWKLRNNPGSVGFVKVGGSVGVALDGFSGRWDTFPEVQGTNLLQQFVLLGGPSLSHPQPALSDPALRLSPERLFTHRHLTRRFETGPFVDFAFKRNCP